MIASDLIRRHLNMFSEDDCSFALRPNDPGEHAPDWHELGIIKHSEEYLRYISLEDGDESTGLLKSWRLYDDVKEKLAEGVDGTSKHDNLKVAAIFHDLGKFTKRRVRYERGIKRATFGGHEAESGRIVREELAQSMRKEGFTPAQIEYIARCTELHFELGKLRHRHKEGDPIGQATYTMALTQTDAFERGILAIQDENPDLALEMGLMFMADSLSKLRDSNHWHALDDEDIARRRALMPSLLRATRQDQRLATAILQLPVNMATARRYLQVWQRRRHMRS